DDTKVLGEGTYAAVVRVFDGISGRFCARKRQFYDTRPSKRLLFEIETLTQLQHHRGIVELLDVCFTSSYIDIVMPQYWGTLLDLFEQSPGRKIEAGLARNITHQLMTAIAYIHTRQIVHHDIKPSNIMLTDEGIVKLGDFGIAARVGTGLMSTGTIGYAAPECLLGCRLSTFQQDTWSTACVVVEMILGRALFAGDTILAVLSDILSFTGHDGGEVLSVKVQCVDSGDIPTSWSACASDAAHRLSDMAPDAASLVQSMLRLLPNRRPHLAQLLREPYFSPAPFPARLSPRQL
ncbi:hypothetical protein OC844_007070, partial [Tilletia horrida]